MANYYDDIIATIRPSKQVAFNAVVMSNVPTGSGLSSSAALE